MESTQLSISVTSNQIIDLARRLSREDKKKLLNVLHEDIDTDTLQTFQASESVLAKDWLSETKNQVWQHL